MEHDETVKGTDMGLSYQDIMNAVAETAMRSEQFAKAVQRIVWTDSRVTRSVGGKAVKISALQELADAKTAAQQANAKADIILKAIEDVPDVNTDQVRAAVQAALASLKADVKLTID